MAVDGRERHLTLAVHKPFLAASHAWAFGWALIGAVEIAWPRTGRDLSTNCDNAEACLARVVEHRLWNWHRP